MSILFFALKLHFQLKNGLKIRHQLLRDLEVEIAVWNSIGRGEIELHGLMKVSRWACQAFHMACTTLCRALSRHTHPSIPAERLARFIHGRI